MIPAFLLASCLSLAVGDTAVEDYIHFDDYAPCGLNSFYLICRLLDVPVSYEEVKEKMGPAAEDGSHSFHDISRAGETLGLHPLGLKADFSSLSKLPLPAIVHVLDPRRPKQPHHLLVLLKVESDGVILLDPPMPAYFLPRQDFTAVWAGDILVFPRSTEETWQLWWAGQSKGIATFTLAALGLTAILAISVLAIRRQRRIASLQPGDETLASRLPSPLGRLKRPRSILAFAVALLLLAGAWAGFDLWHRPAEGAVPLCLIPDEVDLGELPPGETHTQVIIRNGGSQPLTVSAVQSSCICAAVKTPETIEPGGSAPLEVDLNISKGPQRARLVVESNDPQGSKSVFLSWRGRAKPVLDPCQIIAHQVPADRPFERTVKIVYPGGKRAVTPHLERVECDTPYVEVREGQSTSVSLPFAIAGPDSRTLGELEFHVRVTPPSASARVHTICRLAIRYGDQLLKLELPVSVHFLGGEITPEADAVVFSAADRQTLIGQQRSLRITGRSPGLNIQVTDLPKWLECHKEAVAGGATDLRFKIVGLPDGSFNQYAVHIAQIDKPSTRLPIAVYVYFP